MVSLNENTNLKMQWFLINYVLRFYHSCHTGPEDWPGKGLVHQVIWSNPPVIRPTRVTLFFIKIMFFVFFLKSLVLSDSVLPSQLGHESNRLVKLSLITMVFIGLVWFCFFVMIKSSLFLVLFMYTLFFFYYLNVPIDDHDMYIKYWGYFHV